MRKRVMICYADYGFEYKSVALYIKNYFDNNGNFDVSILNLIDYYNEKSKISHIFSPVNRKFFYSILNNKIYYKDSIMPCVRAFDCDRLRNDFDDFCPDIVITTHFYANYLVEFYKSINLINSKIVCILSNSSQLGLWSIKHSDVDAYVVDNDIVKNELTKYGVNSNKIYSYGIPINKSLNSSVLDKDLILKRYSLTGEKPIYLFFGGYDYAFDYFKVLVSKNYPIDVVFIAGKNKDLKIRCENYILKNEYKNVLVLGFSKDIANLFSVSDVVITKPGSNILNECIEMKKPCILIPGVCSKDMLNAKYMVKSHYAVKVRGGRALSRKVKLFLNYPFLVNSMRNKLLKLDDKDSVKKIYDLVNKFKVK